jgi:hypothetical protein
MESMTFNSTNTEEDREEKAVRSEKPAKLSLYSGIIILIGGAVTIKERHRLLPCAVAARRLVSRAV